MTNRFNTTTKELKNYYAAAEEAKEIIFKCAAVAAGSVAVGSTIPVLAIPSIIVGSFGAIWVMYGKVSQALGISLKENALKLLARAALSNISTNMLSLLVASCIPGLGVITGAILTFASVYLAGMMFMELILGMAKRNVCFEDLDVNEMKNEMKNIKVTADDLAEAKSAYDERK